MRAAAKLSQLSGYLSTTEVERINDCIAHLNIPAIPTGLSPQQIIDAMAHDKKQTATGLKWVLLRGIGESFINDKVERDLVAAMLQWLLSL